MLLCAKVFEQPAVSKKGRGCDLLALYFLMLLSFVAYCILILLVWTLYLPMLLDWNCNYESFVIVGIYNCLCVVLFELGLGILNFLSGIC